MITVDEAGSNPLSGVELINNFRQNLYTTHMNKGNGSKDSINNFRVSPSETWIALTFT